MLQSTNLKSYWSFITDKNAEGLAKKYYEYIPEGTEQIWVPSCWNELKEDLFHYEGVAWYYKEVFIEETPLIKRNVLFFNGVNYKCDVWLNGNHVGSHTGGFTPFEFDISKCIKLGEKNLIAVRVDSTMTKMTVPPLGVDWFNYGGIFRDVYINGTGETWLEDITVTTKIDGNIEIKVEIGGYCNTARDTLDILVCDPERANNVVLSSSVAITSNCINCDIFIEDPKLWSIESPFLYMFRLVLRKDGIEMDIWEHSIGIREFGIANRNLMLNNKPLYLRGYSKHEEYPMMGRTFSYDIVRKDYEMCRQAGCNFLRLCHYPHHPEEYEIASQMGFIIMAEIPNLNYGKDHFNNKEIQENSINQLKETIKYYKNEACIMFWSLFIECETEREDSREFVSQYTALTKELDPGRLTIHASIKPVIDKTYEYFDVVGINYWTGWYNGESLEEGSEMLDTIAEKYPDKPVIMTSGGWEGIPNFHSYRSDTKWSEESQADYLVKLTEMYLSKKYIKGEIIWTFNDFRVQPWIDKDKDWFKGWWSLRPMEMNFKGVVDFNRRPKISYFKLIDIFKKWDKNC